MPASSERFEALEWLRSNPSESALAGNRFDGTENAIEFVQDLYKLGAAAVYVTNIYQEEWRLEAEGGPYADTLIVQLPDDPTQRADIFDVAAEEAEEEGFDREPDTGQTELELWWD